MIHLVTALPCEARPVIARHELVPEFEGGGFRVYAGEGLRLIVSGVGKAASTRATAFLAGRGSIDPQATAWLNVGVAGHRSRPIGAAILAHRVTDSATGRSHFPSFFFEPPCPTDEVVTVDRPLGLEDSPTGRGYPEVGACEMEASAFCATATRFTTVELVHCLKVISDNPDAPPDRLQPDEIERLIARGLDVLDTIVDALRQAVDALSTLEVDPPEFHAWRERWRFTVTESRQLRQLLRRRQALGAVDCLVDEELKSCQRAADVLRTLEKALDDLPFGVGDLRSRGMLDV